MGMIAMSQRFGSPELGPDGGVGTSPMLFALNSESAQ
jgi:hypothetical protein